MLPAEYPVTPLNMNYASLGVGTVIIGTSLYFIYSAKYWFRGPQTMTTMNDQSKSDINLES